MNCLLEIAKENKYDVRNTTRKVIKVNGLEDMAYYYSYYVYESFMNSFGDNICQNNGKRYTTDEGDEYICGIDDCTDYYSTVIEMLKYNKQCKHQIQLKAKSTAFFILKKDYVVPFDLRNLIQEYLQ